MNPLMRLHSKLTGDIIFFSNNKKNPKKIPVLYRFCVPSSAILQSTDRYSSRSRDRISGFRIEAAGDHTPFP